MDILNLEENAHNIEQRTSLKLFNPEDEELGIFFTLSKDGPQILTALAKNTSSYGLWGSNRWAINSRMEGTRSNMSLIDYEYIVKKQHETRIRGKKGEVHCLTTKGFLAALSTGKISIEKTYMFKKYKQFIYDILERKMQVYGNQTMDDTKLSDNEKNYLCNISMQYIKYQIYLFLIWHEANEMKLREKINTYWYFVNFFETFNEFSYEKFPKLVNKKRIDEYRTILRHYFIISKILHGIEHYTNSDKKIRKINENLQKIRPFVFEWYRYFEKLQMLGPTDEPYSIEHIPSFIVYPPEYGIDIEYEGIPGHMKLIKPDLKEIVKQELVKITNKEDIQIKEIWNKVQKEKFQKDRFP